jgi:hypothetical protein
VFVNISAVANGPPESDIVGNGVNFAVNPPPPLFRKTFHLSNLYPQNKKAKPPFKGYLAFERKVKSQFTLASAASLE